MESILNSNSFRYGMKMFLSIGAFFLILYALGWAEVSELRFFNLVFVVYFSYKLAKRNSYRERSGSYLRNLSSLFGANIINVIACIVGLVLFNLTIGIDFVGEVADGILLVKTDSLSQVIIALFLEGMAGAATVSFILMQHFKKPRLYAPVE